MNAPATHALQVPHVVACHHAQKDAQADATPACAVADAATAAAPKRAMLPTTMPIITAVGSPRDRGGEGGGWQAASHSVRLYGAGTPGCPSSHL